MSHLTITDWLSMHVDTVSGTTEFWNHTKGTGMNTEIETLLNEQVALTAKCMRLQASKNALRAEEDVATKLLQDAVIALDANRGMLWAAVERLAAKHEAQ
jgi:hypothetical protein